MLPSFNLHLKFKLSKDFLRLLILTQVITLYVSITTLPWYGSLTISIYLLFSCYKNFQRSQVWPHTELIHDNEWKLINANGQMIPCTDAILKFDGRFFLYLKLLNNNKKYSLVIFYDQMTEEERRMIKWLLYPASS